MRLSYTLSLYVGRHFLLAFLGIFLGLLALVFLIDLVETLRRSSSIADVTFPLALEMSLMRIPHIGRQMFPFAVLFSAMMAFWKLTKNQELVIARSAGISVWQFLLPTLLIAFALGVFKITAFSPLAATTLQRYERMEAVYLEGQKSLFTISTSGMWLRQVGESGPVVIHANNALQDNKSIELRGVTVYVYEGKDRFAQRIDADSADLGDGFWLLKNAWIQTPEQAARQKEEYFLETNLTLNKIQDSFARPEVMSFWELPGFINTLEEAGFSATRHKLYLHSLLASPLLLCAMILIAATFTLRKQTRRGGNLMVISSGVLAGFVLYFFSDLVFALGLSDSIPVIMAAWTPSGVASLLGLAMLLHLEDG